jgi:predicted transglutaminase-like cysteine proteinase
LQLLFLALALPALAAPLPALKDTLAPMNAVVFCQHFEADCLISEGKAEHGILLRAPLFAELSKVNGKVNHSFPENIDKVGEPGMDPCLISPPRGNYADYAVTKRHELLELGWPTRDLLRTDALI